jgi:hypothetical protein
MAEVWGRAKIQADGCLEHFKVSADLDDADPHSVVNVIARLAIRNRRASEVS